MNTLKLVHVKYGSSRSDHNTHITRDLRFCVPDMCSGFELHVRLCERRRDSRKCLERASPVRLKLISPFSVFFFGNVLPWIRLGPRLGVATVSRTVDHETSYAFTVRPAWLKSRHPRILHLVRLFQGNGPVPQKRHASRSFSLFLFRHRLRRSSSPTIRRRVGTDRSRTFVIATCLVRQPFNGISMINLTTNP